MRQTLEELQAEVEWLRDELGLAISHDHMARLSLELTLAPQEVRLLLAMKRTRRVMSPAALRDAMQTESIGNIVQTAVCRINRHYPGTVENVRGFGYQLTPKGIELLEKVQCRPPNMPPLNSTFARLLERMN